MSAHLLIEQDVKLIIDHIKTNIAAALQEVSTAWSSDPVSSMPLPKDYFYDEHVVGYRLPFIMAIPGYTDFRLATKGQNFITCLSLINVVAVVEGKTVDILSKLAWRYQAALHKILQGTNLENTGRTVKISIKVARGDFSPAYTDAQAKNNPQGVFKKEVLLACEVEHYEGLT